MRKALSSPDLEFFQSTYLFSPFGVDLINHPHTALQGYISATALGGMSVIAAENLYIMVSVFLNAACAYALAFDIVRKRSVALVAGVAFGGSPYVAAHLLGHFDLLTAWVIPLFALCLRRSLRTGSIAAAVGCGLCVAVAAYAAYYHVVYLALFAVTYTLASWHVVRLHREPRANTQPLFTARLVIMALMALDLFLIVVITLSGGDVIYLADIAISARSVHNPLVFLWLLAFAWLLTKWRVGLRFQRPASDSFWRGAQALMITVATFALVSLPLIAQAFRLALSGRYVSQTYFWRSAPRGVDALAPLAGNPFHPLYGRHVSAFYEQSRPRSHRSCGLARHRARRGVADGARPMVRHRRGAQVEGCARCVCDLGAGSVPDGRGIRHGAAAAAGARALRAARRECAHARPRDGVRVSGARGVDGVATGSTGAHVRAACHSLGARRAASHSTISTRRFP